jgi:hypothetical protein
MNDPLKHALRNRRRRQRPDIGVAEVRVGRAAFGNLLGAMREWLDRNERRPTHFETEADDGGIITIKVRFDDDDLTEIFRQAFGGSDSAGHRAVARQENQQEQRSPLIP